MELVFICLRMFSPDEELKFSGGTPVDQGNTSAEFHLATPFSVSITGKRIRPKNGNLEF